MLFESSSSSMNLWDTSNPSREGGGEAYTSSSSRNTSSATSASSSSVGGNPFGITDDDKQAYPKFAKLLEQISQQHLTREGMVSNSGKITRRSQTCS